MKTVMRQIPGPNPALRKLGLALAVLLLLAVWAFSRMEHEGHIITGMNNHIVWGLPHVFAVFLIVAASGALNVASLASVFDQGAYKPLAPLSALLALALLVGGLSVLLADLGRPERLFVAMTHFNVKSIFSWNVLLYTGFIALVAFYLWTMLERGMNVHTGRAGVAAFAWRIVLTTGTGSIFGFLIAREAFDSAVMAPLFIALSLSYGLAVFILVLLGLYQLSGRALGETVLQRLRRLQVLFIVAGLYFVALHHGTNLYFAKRIAVTAFLLRDGGVYPLLFWGGQIILGSALPLLLLSGAARQSRRLTALAAVLVVLGGLAQMYVTIIGAQSFPQTLFPGMAVTSSFEDGAVHPYAASLFELFLGLGGPAIAGLIVLLGTRLLRILPEALPDPEDGARPAPAASLAR